jgi:hypothetical protein
MKSSLIHAGSLICLFAGMIFSSCEDKTEAKAVPEIAFPSDALDIDMNDMLMPPVICVVNSETGLKSVQLFVVKSGTDGEQLEEPYGNPITIFYNIHSCSVNETPVYTEDMTHIKVIATDLAGQQTVSSLSLNIHPPYPLPEIYFSTDREGLNPVSIDEALIYMEDSEMAELYAQVSSEEDLNYVIFRQVAGAQRTLINDTVDFLSGVKRAAVSAKEWPNGETYVFQKGTTGLNVCVSAGHRNKMRESTLPVQYTYWLALAGNQTDEDFNGLPLDEDVPVSGRVVSANDLQSLTYTLYKRDGSVLQPARPVAYSGKAFDFEFRFTPVNDLGKVVVNAVDTEGKSNEIAYECHAGYRYRRLLARASPGSQVLQTPPGVVFSARNGEIYDLCSASAIAADIDGGFSIWNDNTTICFSDVRNQEKLYSAPGTAKCSANTWPYANQMPFGKFTYATADFDKITLNDFKSSTIPAPGTSATSTTARRQLLLENCTSASPAVSGIVIYETLVDNAPKRVVLVVDRMEEHNPSSVLSSTFWVKFKVQL